MPQNERQIVKNLRRQRKAPQFFDGPLDVISDRAERDFPILPDGIACLGATMFWLADAAWIDDGLAGVCSLKRQMRVSGQHNARPPRGIGRPQIRLRRPIFI